MYYEKIPFISFPYSSFNIIYMLQFPALCAKLYLNRKNPVVMHVVLNSFYVNKD